MKHILETCRKYKVAAGLHCGTAEEVQMRIEEGWQFLAIGSELRMMLNGVEEIVKKLGLGKSRSEMARY
jgi:4-hydroxy-2-oxoheptanedioate aldolase